MTETQEKTEKEGGKGRQAQDAPYNNNGHSTICPKEVQRGREKQCNLTVSRSELSGEASAGGASTGDTSSSLVSDMAAQEESASVATVQGQTGGNEIRERRSMGRNRRSDMSRL